MTDDSNVTEKNQHLCVYLVRAHVCSVFLVFVLLILLVLVLLLVLLLALIVLTADVEKLLHLQYISRPCDGERRENGDYACTCTNECLCIMAGMV